MQPRSFALVVLLTMTVFGSAGYFFTRSLVAFTPSSLESQLNTYNRPLSPSPQVKNTFNFDLDQNGTLTIADYELFLSMLKTNNPRADFDKSGRVDILDYHTLALGFIK